MWPRIECDFFAFDVERQGQVCSEGQANQKSVESESGTDYFGLILIYTEGKIWRLGFVESVENCFLTYLKL